MIQFSEAKLAEVKAIMARYPAGKQKSALLPVLHLAQEEFGGWLDTPVMDYVAQLLSLPLDRVFGLAELLGQLPRGSARLLSLLLHVYTERRERESE